MVSAGTLARPEAAALVNRVEPPVFALSHACCAYEGGVEALCDVSMEIASGEKVAILGANGSGKSTLLRLLNGLVYASSGTVSAFDREITERSMGSEAIARDIRRRMGYLFQNPDAQLFSSTVREEIAFGPLQLGLTRDQVETRIDDLAASLGLRELLDRPPFRLSGGEKKKVALASILAVNPDVLLLDEPVAALDPRTQQWALELIVKLNRAGKTIVTATHDLTNLPLIADRAIVLGEDHAVKADGPIREVLADMRLLCDVNLIHEHGHWHGDVYHSHPHFHGGDHEHEH